MKDLYAEFLKSWKRAGGGLMVLYHSGNRYNQHGSFGLVEWDDQDLKTAPKYQAALQFIRNNQGDPSTRALRTGKRRRAP